MIAHQFKVLESLATSLATPTKGAMGTAFPKQPAKTIKLYDIEACPYCRRVRQALTMLNLDVQIYPCPQNGKRFRPIAEKLNNGKAQFPMLVDENTQTTLVESQAIIDYLFKEYGNTGHTPAAFSNLPKTEVKGSIGSMLSQKRGLKADVNNIKKTAPEQMISLWSFDMSPYTRLVRERLCELEIPYQLINVAKERWQDIGPAVARLKPGKYEPLPQGKRAKLFAQTGFIQVPYLIDPNTNTNMLESKAILAYLNRTYG